MRLIAATLFRGALASLVLAGDAAAQGGGAPVQDRIQSAPVTVYEWRLNQEELAALRLERSELLAQARVNRRLLDGGNAENVALRGEIASLQAQVADLEAQLVPSATEAVDVTAPAAPVDSESVRVAIVDLVLADDPQLVRAARDIAAGRLSAAFATLESYAAAQQQSAIANRDPASLARAAAAWRRVGVLTMARDVPRAMRAFTEAVRLDPLDAEAPRELARLHASQGEFAVAKQFAERALAQASNPEEQIRALQILGGIVMTQRDFERAGVQFAEALRLSEALHRENPSEDTPRELLIGALSDFASNLVYQGRSREAVEFFTRALAIAEAHASGRPSDIDRQLHVLGVQLNLASANETANDLPAAIELRRQMAGRLRGLLEAHPERLEILLLIVHNDMGASINAATRGERSQALALANSAARAAERVSEANRSSVSFKVLYIQSLRHLVLVNLMSNRLPDARRAVARAVDVTLAIPRSSAGFSMAHEIVSQAIEGLGNAAIDRRDRRMFEAAQSEQLRLGARPTP